MRAATTTFLACLIAVLGAPAAQAATVAVSGATLQIVAAPGETNQLAIAPASGAVSVTDSAALTPGAGCTANGAALRCTGATRLTVDLGDGDDTLTVTATLALTAVDGPGDDRVTGSGAADTFVASPGADLYAGAGGTDTVTYAARTTPVLADLAGGSQEDGFTAVENVVGGSAADRLSGTTAVNQLDGGPGDDVLDGRTAGDRLIGGTGADTADYSRRTGNVAADLDGNADDGEAGERDRIATDVEHLLGGAGADALTGNDLPNLLSGGAGGDRLDGNGGDDTLAGGADGDMAWGDAGADALDGGDGNDALAGGDGDDALAGAAGDDGLRGENGNDTISAGIGNDTVSGGEGDDSVSGDDGDDALNGDGGNDTLSGVAGADTLAGGAGIDALSGAEGDDSLAGDAGNDRLSGGDGADRLSGGGEDDVLAGGLGGDELSGDDGWDTADYAGRPEALIIDLDDKADDGARGEADNVRTTIEVIIGGSGGDAITGNGAANHLYGEGGNDRLAGGGANDRIFGGPGRDAISGGKGADSMDGGDGADTITARDGSREAVRCGSSRDRATTDTIDMLFGCEKRTSGTHNWTSKDRGGAGEVTGVRARTGGGRFVAIPGFPGERIDRRLLADIRYLVARYKVQIVDGYALHGHARHGEHPIGLAVDIVPGPGGSWADVDRLAKWAEPRQNRPRSPFRWVGYNGDKNHGRGNHLHLSWSHSATKRGRPARTVYTLRVAR